MTSLTADHLVLKRAAATLVDGVSLTIGGRPAEEQPSLAPAVEQQAEERCLAGLLRGREERDRVLRDQPLPDPRDPSSGAPHAGVATADCGVTVNCHDSDS